MKRLAVIILTGILAGCTGVPGPDQGTNVAAPSPVGWKIDSATIEELILSLPPFEFHEESVEQFAERVRSARQSERENIGKGRDELFVGGDGTAPSKVFVLDRRRQALTIRSLNRDSGMADEVVTMRRVPGGWLRGPVRELQRGKDVPPEQALPAAR